MPNGIKSKQRKVNGTDTLVSPSYQKIVPIFVSLAGTLIRLIEEYDQSTWQPLTIHLSDLRTFPFVCWVLGQNNVLNPKSSYCPTLFITKIQVWKRDAKHSSIPLTGEVFGIYFPEKKRIAH